jgi:hypothetical protein
MKMIFLTTALLDLLIPVVDLQMIMRISISDVHIVHADRGHSQYCCVACNRHGSYGSCRCGCTDCDYVHAGHDPCICCYYDEYRHWMNMDYHACRYGNHDVHDAHICHPYLHLPS